MWADWTAVVNNKRFVVFFGLALALMVAFAAVLPYYFNEILLPKPGIQLADPVLLLLTPRDWSIPVFVLLYSVTIASVVLNARAPYTMLLLFQMYGVVNLMRLASLYLFTLEAPEGIIPLSDPFLAVFAYGKAVYVKDLFFSGHVSTLCILFLAEPRKVFKRIILVATVLLAVMLAWQRVHYTLDMLAAPLASWLVFKFFTWLNASLGIPVPKKFQNKP